MDKLLDKLGYRKILAISLKQVSESSYLFCIPLLQIAQGILFLTLYVVRLGPSSIQLFLRDWALKYPSGYRHYCT